MVIKLFKILCHYEFFFFNFYFFLVILYFFILFIYFLEREMEGDKEGEKHQCAVASHVPPTGDQACNPGMCPDWESNQRPFGSQASTQSTELHQPGHHLWVF